MFQINWLFSLAEKLRTDSTRHKRSKQNRNRNFAPNATSVVASHAEALEERILLTVFNVENTNDSGEGSLREAIELANANAGADTITFRGTFPSNTITLNRELLITDDLTISCTFHNRISINGNDNSRLFVIDDGALGTMINVTINRLVLKNGSADHGGAIHNSENLSLTGCSFFFNQAYNSGGAISSPNGNLTLIDTAFKGNKATNYGGAINAGPGSLTIDDSRFTGNSANSGGAIALHGVPMYFRQLYSFPAVSVSIENSLLDENTARDSGGAIYYADYYSQGKLVIENSEFKNNDAELFSGGAIYSYLGTVTITDSKLTANTAGISGGALYSDHGTTSIENSTLWNNAAGSDGGGVFNLGGHTTLLHSTLAQNSAESNGGGIFSAGTLSFFNSTLSGNSAGGSGGAVYQILENDVTPSSITLTDFSVSDRRIPEAPDTLTIINSTIVGNTAASSGGGIYGLGANVTPTVSNSIVAGNTATTSAQIAGPFTGNSNIIQGSIEGLLDPLLRSNGGRPQTHALLTGSTAINAGNNNITLSAGLMTDQRGVGHERIYDGKVDIGAFESNAYNFVVDTTSDEDDGDYSSGNLSLREAIRLANATPDVDTITFTEALSGQTIVLNTELLITDDLIITGLGADRLTLDGNYNSRIFNIDDGKSYAAKSVEISGLTLTHGYAENGGAIFNNESLYIIDCMISENEATANGGGIYNLIQNITISNTTFYRNIAANRGGGFFGAYGYIGDQLKQIPASPSSTNYLYSRPQAYNFTLISNSHFIENSAQTGGGIYKAYHTPHLYRGWCGTIIIPRILPGISLRGAETSSNSGFFIVNTTIEQNTAYHGGGIYNSSGLMEISSSSITDNFACHAGGGIYNSGRLFIEESTISLNAANYGGGFYSPDIPVKMENNSISENMSHLLDEDLYSGPALAGVYPPAFHYLFPRAFAIEVTIVPAPILKIDPFPVIIFCPVQTVPARIEYGTINPGAVKNHLRLTQSKSIEISLDTKEILANVNLMSLANQSWLASPALKDQSEFTYSSQMTLISLPENIETEQGDLLPAILPELNDPPKNEQEELPIEDYLTLGNRSRIAEDASEFDSLNNDQTDNYFSELTEELNLTVF